MTAARSRWHPNTYLQHLYQRTMKTHLTALLLACALLSAQEAPQRSASTVVTLTIHLPLTQEQRDSVEKQLQIVNAANAKLTPPLPPITAEVFLQDALAAAVQSWVRTDYESAVKQLGEDAAKLDYQTRKALIQQVKEATQ
jgi:hypothetical protein